MKKITYALPAFNEAENLPALLKSLETAGAQVRHLGYAVSYVIVDDGSTDATPAILAAWAKDRDATIITHSPNQGLGKTISDALECAARHASPEDIIVTLDADNTQPPGLLTAMVLKVIEGNDLVIASRYRYGARVLGLAWHRHLMSWGAAGACMTAPTWLSGKVFALNCAASSAWRRFSSVSARSTLTLHSSRCPWSSGITRSRAAAK